MFHGQYIKVFSALEFLHYFTGSSAFIYCIMELIWIL